MDKTAYLHAMGVPVWVARTTVKKPYDAPVYLLYSMTKQPVGCLLGSWADNQRPLLGRMLAAIDLTLVDSPESFDESPLLPTLLLGADTLASVGLGEPVPAICEGDQSVKAQGGRLLWCLPTLSTLVDEPAKKALAWRVLKAFKQALSVCHQA